MAEIVWRAWLTTEYGEEVFTSLHRSRRGAEDALCGELEKRHQDVRVCYEDWAAYYNSLYRQDGRDIGITEMRLAA